MALSLLPATAFAGQAEACAAAPGDVDFDDVDETGGTFGEDIACVGDWGWVDGFTDNTYRPSDNLTRGQATKFVANFLETATGDTLPEADPNPYDDVDPAGTFGTFILKLTEAGIVDGVDADSFDPSGTLTRGQMAKIVAEALEFLGITLDTTDNRPDDDVEDTDVFSDWINALLNLGVVEGDTDGNYNGSDPVTRGQFAQFVARSAGVADDANLFAPTASNQSFAVTPQEESVNDLSTSIADNTGRHAYSVSGLDTAADYDIALLPAENVTVAADGTVSFSSVATVADNSGPSIEIVNGSQQTLAGSGNETEQANNVSPQTDGTITFSIDSDAADEVIPVIWLDAEATGDNMLDRDADGVPSEDFGIGGQKNWVPAEALATDTGGTVTTANQNLDYFVAGGDTYYYDSNDLFRYQGGANVDMSVFEGMLTVDDVISVVYDPDEADTSIFNVTTDVVPSPTNLKATMSDLDGDGTADDATLTWTRSKQGDAVYNVYIDGGGVANEFDAGDTAVSEERATTSITINNAAGNTYHVGAEGDVSGSVSTGDPSVSPATPVDAAPDLVASGAAVETNAGGAGATTGDVWHLFFSEGVSLASDASVALGGGAVVERGVNSTWTVNGSMVVITLTADLSPATGYAATINSLAGVTDADEGGKAATVTDNSLEDDGPEFYTNTADTGDTEFTIVFNEALFEASAENIGNYVYSDGDGLTAGDAVTSAVLSADGRTVTLTVNNAVAATATVDPTGVLDADAQASAQGPTAVN